MLTFDENTRSLTLGGADAYTTKKKNYEDQWVELVEKNPGLTTSDLSNILGKRVDDKGFKSARKNAIANHRVKTHRIGTSDVWYTIDYIPTWSQGQVAN